MKNSILFLLQKDEVFQKILDLYGEPIISSRPEGFESLCKLIIEQQVSLASAKACYLKMESFLGKITPQNILNTKDEDLRNNSVSRQKVVYLKELSKVIVSKDLKLDTLSAKTDEQIKSELTKVKKIIPNEMIVFDVKGNKFILKTTNKNLAKLYKPMEIKVAMAAPSIPKFGIKYIFKLTVRTTKHNPKNNTVL